MSTTTPRALEGIVQGLHHVAIAVRDLDEARKVYEGALGLSYFFIVEQVPDQGPIGSGERTERTGHAHTPSTAYRPKPLW